MSVSVAIWRAPGWRWLARLFHTERERRGVRRNTVPGLVAYYWDGATPVPHRVSNISPAGAYLVGAGGWLTPGTILELTLQLEGSSKEVMALPVKSCIVRLGADGAGVRFLHPADRRSALVEFLRAAERRAGSAGQSLIEFALVLPLLFLLIINTVNFGAFFYAWITVANAARTGAQYMVMGGATINAPVPPTAAAIQTLVTNDTASLLNGDSLQVRVCKNNNAVVTCAGPGSYVPPPDPEPSFFVLGTVDVTYTYEPPIPLWSFPGLGIHATLPPLTIHRQTAMRMLQ